MRDNAQCRSLGCLDARADRLCRAATAKYERCARQGTLPPDRRNRSFKCVRVCSCVYSYATVAGGTNYCT
eukprot:8631856-Pyramimonas_sp.AAC.1